MFNAQQIAPQIKLEKKIFFGWHFMFGLLGNT